MTKLDELEKLARNDLRLIESGTYSYANWKILAEGTLKLVAVARAAKHFTDPKTQVLQITAMTAYSDMEAALKALEELKGE